MRSSSTTEERTYSLGPVLPHVRRVAELVGNKFGLTSILGWRLSARDKAGHPAGLALDFMCSPAQGDAITAFLQANHEALGLDYLIWKQRSWDPDTGWTAMEDRGSPTQNHMDHVHGQFKLLGGSGQTLNFAAGSDGGESFLDWLNPVDNWADNALGIGIKLLAGGTAAALVVVGVIRTVSPGGTSS